MPELTDRINTSAHTSEDFAQKCRQEIYVLSVGTIGGAAKEFSKHPVKTIGDTACMGASAVALTAIAAAELPVVSIVAAGTGAVYGASFAWNFIDPQSPHNLERNRSLQKAMTTAWTTSDKGALQNSISDLQEKTGSDSLQIFQSFAVGGAASKYGLKTVDMVNGLARLRPSTLALDSITSNASASDSNLKVPTWDEYVNLMRRHGPVTTKSIHNFELDKVLETAAKINSKNDDASQGAKEEDKAASKHSTQKMESTQSAQGQKSNHAQEHKEEEENTNRGSSLYFGERFGRYHH